MSDFPINRPIDATRHLRGPQGDAPAAPPPGTEDPGLVLGHFLQEIGRFLGTSAEGKVPERHAPAVQALRAMLAQGQVPIFATLPPPPGGGPLSGEGGGGVRAVDTARPPGPFARANDHLLGRFMPPLPGERPDAAFARLIDGFQPPVPQGAIGEVEAQEIRAIMLELARVRSDHGHLPLGERDVADITREAMRKVLGLEATEPLLTGGDTSAGRGEVAPPPGTTFA
jgi:hypothetical protein